MVGGNAGNQFRQYAGQNVRNQVVQNVVQNMGVQNVGNQNGVIIVPGIANQNGSGNVVEARVEGNANGNNGNRIRCYNCKGLGHLARNCIVRPRRKDAAYLQTQLLIAQKEEAGIQLQAEEFDLIAVVADLDEIEETDQLRYNFMIIAIMMRYLICLLKRSSILSYSSLFLNHQVLQNDSNVTSVVSSVEQGGGTVEQHPKNVEETRVLYDSLYNNLATEVEKVNSVNSKMRETSANLTTQLARYKNQEKCFEIGKEKYDKLERCYQQSVYQEQCLTKKIIALHLSSEEKKRLKSDFKIREDELLDKQIQLENKHDPPTVYDSEETLELAQESRLKMKQLNKEIKPANYTNINHLSGVFVSQTAKSRKELYLSNTFKTANVSKSISIPNEELLDDTTPSVARKFLNELMNLLLRNKALELEIECFLRAVVSQDIMSIVQNNSVVDTSILQTELERMKERFENCIIKKENEYAKLWNDWVSSPRSIKTHALSKPFTSNSVPTPQESKVVNNDKVIAPGMFRINPFKPSREEKYVPNKVRASVRTNLITVSQPHVITKKDVNSDSNGLSSTGVDNTAKTRRPQPRSNTKNDRVPSTSKSSCSKNKEVKNDLRILGSFGAKGEYWLFHWFIPADILISLGLNLTYAPSTITTQQPTKGELDLLFKAMYDDHNGGQPLAALRTVSTAQAPQVTQTPTATTTIADTAPTPTNSSSQATNFPNTSHDVDEI
ncbi:retrovirus-related pol polyprotein from transposon TNT 1-94 [Tanacetum coccineum]